MVPFVLALGVLLALLVTVLAPAVVRRIRVERAVRPHLAIRDHIVASSRARFGHGAFAMLGGNAVITRLEGERQAQFDFIDKLTGEVEAAGRDMVDAERQNVEAAQARVKEIDAQLKPLRDFEALRSADQQSAARFEPTGGGQRGSDDDQRGAGDQGQRGGRLGARTNDVEHKYRSAGEFLADTYAAGSGSRNVTNEQRDAARDRLRSHGLSTEGGQLHRAAAPSNTTAEIPGLLPEPIIGAIMSDVDAARPFITSIGAGDLGGIPGETFSRPTITQHVQVDKQAAELTTVANRQFKVGSVPFTKDTYGGWADVSKQSINWSSPAVWNALMTDFIEQYGLETESAAANDFATAVVQVQHLATSTSISDADLRELLAALYQAAVQSYQGSGRLPDTIWCSLDWWAVLGPLMDYLKASTAGNGAGETSVDTFAGNLLRVPRIIVPSFPDETLIVGVKSRTEVYEDRYGFLSVIEPKVFGLQIAYGGEMASGTVKPAAFTKLEPHA